MGSRHRPRNPRAAFDASKIFSGASTASARHRLASLGRGHRAAGRAPRSQSRRGRARHPVRSRRRRDDPRRAFRRKNYFYPDLPKGYQISQTRFRSCMGLAVDRTPRARRSSATRAHLEEDAGKSLHEAITKRASISPCRHPLLEIVSEPDRGARRGRDLREEAARAPSSGSTSATATAGGKLRATPMSRCGGKARRSSAPAAKSRIQQLRFMQQA